MAKSPPRRTRVPLVILASICLVLGDRLRFNRHTNVGSTSTLGETEAETPDATSAGTLTNDGAGRVIRALTEAGATTKSCSRPTRKSARHALMLPPPSTDRGFLQRLEP